MRTIAIDDSLAWFVYPSVARAGCTKTAERIDVLSVVETSEDPKNTRNIVLDGSPTARRRGFDAALSNYFGHLLALTVNVQITVPTAGVTGNVTPAIKNIKLYVYLLRAYRRHDSAYRISQSCYTQLTAYTYRYVETLLRCHYKHVRNKHCGTV